MSLLTMGCSVANAGGLDSLSPDSINAIQKSDMANSVTSGSNAANQGNNQNITFNSGSVPEKQTVRYEGEYTLQNVPSVSGPALVTSNDTCMGSTSGSFNIAGLGLGGGTTWTDVHCKRLKQSRELWNKGFKAASIAMDCLDPDAHKALNQTGFMCPGDAGYVVPVPTKPSEEAKLELHDEPKIITEVPKKKGNE